MLDPIAVSATVPSAVRPLDLHGGTAVEVLRRDAGVIHRRLRRIAEAAASGGAPHVEDLDRVAQAVADLHRRILEITREDASDALADVVAARQSIHHALVLVQEVADEVLAV